MSLQQHFTDDGGRHIDWSRTSSDYSQHRPDFPAEFYERLAARDIGLTGQRILDLGTGVGFLAENFARRGAVVTGIDIAEGQLTVARERAVAAGLTIEYRLAPAEATGMETGSFDVATASQCWLYFDKPRATDEARRVLRLQGLLAISHFCWLPQASELAQLAEDLVLKYNPCWTGAKLSNDIPTEMPEYFSGKFQQVDFFVYDAPIPFTRASWRGRWRACRGVGATLAPEQIAAFDSEHEELLRRCVGEQFTVPHRIDCRILQRL